MKQIKDDNQNGDDSTASTGDQGAQDPSAADNSSASTGTQQIADLQQELEQTQTKLQEMTKITQHALADLQNFKRRSEEEKSSFATYANADLILALLPAIDNINRALAHEPKDTEWAKGVEQSLKQLTQTLEKRGLTVIPTTGQKFDPRLHEALLTGPGEKDMILAELEKGYILGEKVIKPARVKVGS